MDHRHSYDIERRQELHNEIDKLPVPDDHSNSDLSAEYTPNRSRVDRPQTSESESFGNSINSPIPQGSPELQFRESEIEFTQQQVNKVMDWSQTHITPSEGRFPQVSAPTMEIESETNEFELVDGLNDEPISAVEHAEESVSKDKSLEFDALRASDLPMTRQVPRKAKDSLTFSPSRQQAQQWFFTPGGRRPSKHSLPHSGNTSEVLGSALLSGPNQSHHGDSAYKTALDHSVMQDEVYKLKTSNAQIRAALKEEQDKNMQAQKDLRETRRQLDEAQTQAEDMQSYCDLLRAKDQSSLEELRGRQLEFARAELGRLKTALAEREGEIISLKHTLSMKLSSDSPNSRDKENEELALENARLRLLNAGTNKKAQETQERLQMAEKLRAQSDLEVRRLSEELVAAQKQVAEFAGESQRLQKEISVYQSRLKEFEAGVNQRSDSISREQQELRSLQMTIDSLKQENDELRAGTAPIVDYQAQIAKMKGAHEAAVARLKRQGDETWLKKADEWKALEQRLRAEIEELREVQSECEREYNEELSKATNAAKSEREKFLATSRENRQLQTQLQDALDDASALREELEVSEAARTKAEEVAEKLRRSVESPRAKQGSRRPSIDPQAIDGFQAQIESLRAEQEKIIHRAKAERLQLEQELTAMRQKREESKTELADIRSEYAALRQENIELRQKLDPRKREMTLSEEFEAKLSELGMEKEEEPRTSISLQTSFQENAEELKRQLREAEDKVAELEQGNEELAAHVESLTVSVQKLTESRAGLHAGTNTSAVDEEASEIRAQFAEELETIREKEEEREAEWREATQRLSEDLSAAQQELADKEEQLRTSEERRAADVAKAESKAKRARDEAEALKKNYEQQLLDMQTECQAEIDEYKKRQSEMATLHDQFRKATTQQSEDDLLQTQREKDEEWQLKLRQLEEKLRAAYEEKLLAREEDMARAKAQLGAQWEQSKAELVEKLREEGSVRMEKAKQEQLRAKREHDRDMRKLQEELDHVTDRSRQQLEIEFLSRLNAEKKEADRKAKAKAKVVQEKHQQELVAQEALLKVHCEKAVADAQKALSDQHRAVLRQKEVEFANEIERLHQEHEDAIRQLSYEKSQLQTECDRRAKHVPSLEASASEFPFGRSRDFRASKSGFQDSVLTINDFRPEESEILSWTQAHNDRTGMLKEDLRSYWAEEADRRLAQKLVEKAKIQKFVETQCRAARDSEQQLVLQTLTEELERLLTGTGPRPRAQHRELAGKLQSFLGHLRERVGTEYDGRVKELKAAQDAIVQKYRAKVAQLETALLQKTKKEPSPLPPDTDMEDSVFVRVGGHLYISLKCTVDDLTLVCESFEAALAPKKPTKRVMKAMDPDASLEKQKDMYRSLLNSLQRIAADVSWALRNQVKERPLMHDEIAQCSLSKSELTQMIQDYEEKLALCHQEMENMELRFKRELQDATGSLSSLSELRQEWEGEKEALEAELLTAKDKLREWEESPALIPEMLSPSETCELVFSIFNRSNRETFLGVMTEEHPEFLTLLREFLDATVDL